MEVKINPGTNDRLASFFINIFNKSSHFQILAGSIYFVYWLIPLGIAYFSGNFINESLRVDAYHAYGYLVQSLLATLLLAKMIGDYLNKFSETIERLMSEGIIKFDENDQNDRRSIIENINNIFSNNYVKWLPIILGILLMCVSTLIVSYNGNHWLAPCPPNNSSICVPSVSGLLVMPTLFIHYYLVSFLAVKLWSINRVLNFLFKEKNINIQPLHPDGCGGISSLGALASTLSLRFFVLGIIGGAWLAHGILQQQPENIVLYVALGSLLYLVLTCCIFFVPLYPTSKCMKRKKTKIITELSNEFSPINERVHQTLVGKGEIDTNDVKKLESIKELYDIANQMPVYPFNRESLRKFYVTVIAPLTTILLISLKQIINFLINQVPF